MSDSLVPLTTGYKRAFNVSSLSLSERKRFGNKTDPNAYLLEKNKEALIRAYSAGDETLRVIAERFGVAESSISNAIRRWGVSPRNARLRKETQIILDNKDEIIRLYRSGWTAARIGKKFRLGESTLNLRLKAWGVVVDRRKIIPEVAVEMIKKGYNTKQIADYFGTDSGGVSKILNKRGIYGITRVLLSSSEKAFLNKMYKKKGHSIPEILSVLKANRRELNNLKYPAEELSVAVLYNRIRDWGLKKDKIIPKPDDYEKRIVDDFAMGYNVARISADLRVPKSFVYNTLKKFWKPKYVSRSAVSVELAEKARNLRRNGIPVEEIVLRTRMSKYVAKKILEDVDAINKNKSIDKSLLDYYAAQIRALRKIQGVTIDMIAKRLKIRKSLVEKIIRENNIPRTNLVYTDEVKAKILKLYNEGVHYRDIAKKLDLKTESIRQELSRLGVNLGISQWNRSYSPRAIMKQNELIKKFYSPKYRASIGQISRALKIDKTTVRARIRGMGMKVYSKEEILALKRKKFDPNKKLLISRHDRVVLEERG